MDGHAEAMRILINTGADPYALNFLGETPLFIASYAKQDEAVQILGHIGCP